MRRCALGKLPHVRHAAAAMGNVGPSQRYPALRWACRRSASARRQRANAVPERTAQDVFASEAPRWRRDAPGGSYRIGDDQSYGDEEGELFPSCPAAELHAAVIASELASEGPRWLLGRRGGWPKQ
jgi:hypothetical protein